MVVSDDFPLCVTVAVQPGYQVSPSTSRPGRTRSAFTVTWCEPYCMTWHSSPRTTAGVEFDHSASGAFVSTTAEWEKSRGLPYGNSTALDRSSICSIRNGDASGG